MGLNCFMRTEHSWEQNTQNMLYSLYTQSENIHTTQMSTFILHWTKKYVLYMVQQNHKKFDF